MPETTKHYPHPRQNRIGGQGSFKVILDRGVRVWRGPVCMCIALRDPDASPAPKRSRLGISIGRPVGNAVIRNQIKRLLREAFRLMQHEWPQPFDVVLLIKRHDPLPLAEYQQMLAGLMAQCVRKWNEKH